MAVNHFDASSTASRTIGTELIRMENGAVLEFLYAEAAPSPETDLAGDVNIRGRNEIIRSSNAGNGIVFFGHVTAVAGSVNDATAPVYAFSLQADNTGNPDQPAELILVATADPLVLHLGGQNIAAELPLSLIHI